MDGEREPVGLDAALERSSELASLVRATWDALASFQDPRRRTAEEFARLSLEHGCAVQALLGALPASGIALVRLQYETLVRAVWVAHSASDSELARLLAPLSTESQQAAKKLPGVPAMLQAIDKTGPRGAAALLGRARVRLGEGLNSFVHGGIHPLARQREGYPVVLLLGILMNSNALAVLTLAVLSAIAEDTEIHKVLLALNGTYQDVLPALEPLG